MSQPKPNRRADLIIAGAAAAIALAAGALALGFPKDARMWPLFGVAVTLVGAIWAAARLLHPRAAAILVDEDLPEPLVYWRRTALFVGVIVIFDLLLSTLGFVTAAAFALIATPLLLGERRWAMTLGTAVVFLVSAYLLFNKLVQKSLPPDWFWD